MAIETNSLIFIARDPTCEHYPLKFHPFSYLIVGHFTTHFNSAHNNYSRFQGVPH